MLEFLAPAWFLLLIPAIAGLYFLRTAKRIVFLFRSITVLLVILALTQPRLSLERNGGVLVVLADRSASMPEDAVPRQKEIIALLEKNRGFHDEVAVVSFSERVFIEKAPGQSVFTQFNGSHSGNASNIANAVEQALMLIPNDRNGRILLLSDGRFTGMSPLDAAALAAGRGTPVDYRSLERIPVNDAAILSLNPPPMAEKGESFRFTSEIQLPEDSEIVYSLKRDLKEIAAGKLRLKAGRHTLSFRDRMETPGDFTYRLEIQTGFLDPVPQNNIAEAVTTVSGSKPMLIIGSPSSRLARLAGEAGLNVFFTTPEKMVWTPQTLSKFASVVLENIPADKPGYDGQLALRNFVENGGGLMMTGGRMSFGLGGYFSTPLAPVLPVSMELRKEHRKLRTAVVVALDRSGSMTLTVPDGRSKMDLANLGTATLAEMLSPGDKLGVIAVDSQAHTVVPMTEITAENKLIISSRIREIQSMGGGIFIYEALLNASKMLMDVDSGTRHIILFADAADSEEPGNYKELLNKLKDAGITLSVIGLGAHTDIDADLLADLAKLGGGNLYFSNSGLELPQLFSQEAVSVFRNSFIEEPADVVKTEDLRAVMTPPKGTVPPVGGYNLTYLKPEASAALVSADSYKAPLMAFWTRGAGRVMALTFEADGKYTGEFGRWNHAGELLLSALRWLSPGADSVESSDFFIRTELRDGTVSVYAELDPERKKDPFISLPVLVEAHQSSAGIERRRHSFEWIGKDLLQVRLPLPVSGIITLFAEWTDKGTPDTLKMFPCGSYRMIYPLEFRPENDIARGRKTLSRMAELSGGTERLDLGGIFSSITPRIRSVPLWHLLAVLSAFLLLTEIALLRFGVPERFSGGRRRNPTIPRKNMPSWDKDRIPKTVPEKEAPSESRDSLSDALSHAKKRGQKRF